MGPRREWGQAAADQVLRQCLVHALRSALRPRASPASVGTDKHFQLSQSFPHTKLISPCAEQGLPAIAQIQQEVYTNLLSLPPKLQEGFDQLRIDAEKVSAGVCALLPANDQGQLSSTGQKASEVASNAAALADMLIATNTVHSFQLGDGDRQVRILPRGPCGSHTRSKHGRTSSGC